MENNKKQIVVAISGAFDPIHIGHIRLIREAKKLGISVSSYIKVKLFSDGKI